MSKKLRKLSRVSISGTRGSQVGVYTWVVLDDNGVGTKHKATQAEIAQWYLEDKQSKMYE